MNYEQYEKYMQTEFGIPLIHLFGLDEELIKEFIIGIQNSFQKFPILQNVICSIGEKENILNEYNLVINSDRKLFNKVKGWDNNISNEYIFTLWVTPLHYKKIKEKFRYVAIGYNIEAFKDAKGIMQMKYNCAIDNYHPKDCLYIRHAIYHEIGHILDFMFNLSQNKELIKIIQDRSNNYELISQKISEYADSKYNIKEKNYEIFASAIAEYMCDEFANDLVNAIGKYTEEQIKLNEKNSYNYNLPYKKHLIRLKK